MALLKQNSKDPLWTVTLRIAVAHRGPLLVGPNGDPLASKPEYGDEQQITVHAVDEVTALAYVEQQNPACNASKAERTEP